MAFVESKLETCQKYMHTYRSQSPKTLCKRFTETEAAAEKHTDEKKTTKILSNLVCCYEEHCSCSSSKGTYSSVTRLHMLYFFILQIDLRYVELNHIFYMSQVEKKNNIPFTLDNLHPEIRENKCPLKVHKSQQVCFLWQLNNFWPSFLCTKCCTISLRCILHI